MYIAQKRPVYFFFIPECDYFLMILGDTYWGLRAKLPEDFFRTSLQSNIQKLSNTNGREILNQGLNIFEIKCSEIFPLDILISVAISLTWQRYTIMPQFVRDFVKRYVTLTSNTEGIYSESWKSS